MKYQMEEIKGSIVGLVIAQIILLIDNTSRKEISSITIDTLVPRLKECGIDFEENPKNLLDFFMYLQENNQGLYLLLKTTTSNLLMANPKDCDDSIFSEDIFGMSKTDKGFLIRGMNTILFLFESIYKIEGEKGGGLTLDVWIMCRKIWENTLDVVAEINGMYKDDPEFALCIDEFKSTNSSWAFYFERIQEILKENETLDENVKYFEPWWNGK